MKKLFLVFALLVALTSGALADGQRTHGRYNTDGTWNISSMVTDQVSGLFMQAFNGPATLIDPYGTWTLDSSGFHLLSSVIKLDAGPTSIVGLVLDQPNGVANFHTATGFFGLDDNATPSASITTSGNVNVQAGLTVIFADGSSDILVLDPTVGPFIQDSVGSYVWADRAGNVQIFPNGGVVSIGGPLDTNGNAVTGVPDPVGPLNAVNLQYFQAHSGGGGVTIIPITYVQAQAYSAGQSFVLGQLYNITDANETDLGFVVPAMSVSQLALSGSGGFLNVDFSGAGDYSGVTITNSPGTQWDETLGTTPWGDSSGVTYGDTVTDSTSGATGIVYQISGNDVLVHDVNGVFASGDTVVSAPGGGSSTLTGDITYSNTYVTGNVVIFQDQGTGAWEHAEKLTDTVVSSRPESDGTNWAVLSRSVTNGYIPVWDACKYSLADNWISERADNFGNRVSYVKLSSGVNITNNGFPWGAGSIDIAQSCILGDGCIFRIQKPIDYMSDLTVASYFTLNSTQSNFDFYENVIGNEVTVNMNGDYGQSSVYIGDCHLNNYSIITMDGNYLQASSFDGVDFANSVIIDNGGFGATNSSFSANLNMTLTQFYSAQNIIGNLPTSATNLPSGTEFGVAGGAVSLAP